MEKQHLSSITIPKSTIDLWFQYFFNIERNKRSKSLDITQKQLIRDFVSFLRKKNVFYRYFTNFITYNSCRKVPHLYKDCGRLFIYNAYAWDATYEGDKFWCKLHFQWLDLYGKTLNLYKKSI